MFPRRALRKSLVWALRRLQARTGLESRDPWTAVRIHLLPRHFLHLYLLHPFPPHAIPNSLSAACVGVAHSTKERSRMVPSIRRNRHPDEPQRSLVRQSFSPLLRKSEQSRGVAEGGWGTGGEGVERGTGEDR